VSQQMFNGGRMMTGNLPVVPSRENLSASNRAAAPSTIRGGQQSFFSKSQPMATQSFDKQAASVQSAIQHNGFTPIRSAASEGVTKTGAMTANNTFAKPSAGTPVQNSTLNRGNSPVATGTSNSLRNNGDRTFGSPVAQNKGTQNPANNSGASSTVPRPPQVQNTRPQTTTSTGSDQGWRRFSDSTTGSQNHNVAQPMNNRSFGSTGSTNNVGSPNHINSVPRPPQSSTAGSTGSNGNWRTFSSSGNSGQLSNRGGQVNDQWNRFPSRSSTPTTSSPRGSSYFGGGVSGSRPPLNMQKNIVTPRSYGTTSYRGGGSAPHVSSGSSSHSSGSTSHSSSGHSGHR